MIAFLTLCKLVRRNARVHVVTLPDSSQGQGYACHYASKAQADKHIASHKAIWSSLPAVVYSTRPASDFVELAHTHLI